MVHYVELAVISENKVRNTSVKTESPTNTMGRENLESFIPSEVKSVVKSVRLEDIKRLVEKTIRDVFTTGYYAAMDGRKNSFFSFVEEAITDKNYLEVLGEPLNQNFVRYSLSDTIVETLTAKIVDSLGFIAPVATFVMQRVTNAIEEELHDEQKVTMGIPSSPDQYPSASAGSTLDK